MTQEDIAQINIVAWFKHKYPEYKDDIHHIANQRKCSVQQGRQLKRMGVTKGISDLMIAVPVDGKCGLWLELKSEKGKLSPEQELFLKRKNIMGYMAIAAWGESAAIKVIQSYIAGII